MGPRDAILLLLLGAGCVAGEASPPKAAAPTTTEHGDLAEAARTARETLRPAKAAVAGKDSAKRRGSLDDRVSFNGPASGRNAVWRGFQYPVPSAKIEGVDLYRVDREGDSGLYVVQTGLLINAPEGTLVRYHPGIFTIGDSIKETKVLAVGNDGPEGFPELGRYVRLRHTLETSIPGIGDRFDTVYGGLQVIDANASAAGAILPEDAPDGGVLLGTVGKTGGAAKPGLRLMIIPGTTPEAPPMASYGTPLSPYGLLTAVSSRRDKEE